jgi:glutaredoxin
MGLLIDSLKKEYPILIISKPACPRCDDIKQNLDEVKESYKCLDVSKIEDIYEVDSLSFVDELKNSTGCNSYPFCFYKGSFIPMDMLKKKLIKLTFDEDTNDF